MYQNLLDKARFARKPLKETPPSVVLRQGTVHRLCPAMVEGSGRPYSPALSLLLVGVWHAEQGMGEMSTGVYDDTLVQSVNILDGV